MKNERIVLKIKNTYFNSNLKLICEFLIFKAAAPLSIAEPDGIRHNDTLKNVNAK